MKLRHRLWGIVWIVLMSPFSLSVKTQADWVWPSSYIGELCTIFMMRGGGNYLFYLNWLTWLKMFCEFRDSDCCTDGWLGVNVGWTIFKEERGIEGVVVCPRQSYPKTQPENLRILSCADQFFCQFWSKVVHIQRFFLFSWCLFTIPTKLFHEVLDYIKQSICGICWKQQILHDTLQTFNWSICQNLLLPGKD